MPIYSITAPNGKTYEIEGPEGASDAQVAQEVMRQFPDAGNPPAKPTLGGYVKEALKGIPAGAAGMLESAAIGASAALPEFAEKPARKAIEAVAAPVREALAPNSGYEDSIVRKGSEAVGSTLPFFLTRGAGALGLGTASGAGQQRVQAEQEGATDAQRAAATGLGAIVGSTESLPVFSFINRLGTPLKNGISAVLQRAFHTGGEEALQEAASNIAHNLIAKGIYKPNQEILEGTGESAGYGFGVGALIDGLTSMVLGRRAHGAKQTGPTEQEQLAQERRKAQISAENERMRGVLGKEGEALINAQEKQDAAQQKADAAKLEERAAKEISDARKARQAELEQAFPKDYSDVMQRTDAYAELFKEKQALEGQRKTAELRSRIQQINDRMAAIVEEDNRVPNEFLRIQKENQQATKQLPPELRAKYAAQAFATPQPQQIEMREATVAQPPVQQTDLFGNPVAPTQAPVEAEEKLRGPKTLEQAKAQLEKPVRPTRQEMTQARKDQIEAQAAGQLSLPLRRTNAAPTTTAQQEADVLNIPAQNAAAEGQADTSEPVVRRAPTLQTIDPVLGLNLRKLLGVGPSANLFKPEGGIVGKDLRNQADAISVRNTLEDYLERPTLSPNIVEKVNEFLQRPEFRGLPERTETAPTSDAKAAAPNAPTVARGSEPSVAVPSKPAAGGESVQPTAAAATRATEQPVGLGLAPAGGNVGAGVRKPRGESGALGAKARVEKPAVPVSAFTTLAKQVENKPTVEHEQPSQKLPEPKNPFEAAARAWPTKQNTERKSVGTGNGQSIDALHREVTGSKSTLNRALRRMIASGKVKIEARHPTIPDAGGLYDGKSITLYSENIKPGEAIAVALHEVGAHLGLKNLLGERQYNNIIARIQSMATGGTTLRPEDRAIAQRAIRRIPKEDIARGAEVYGDETVAYFIEELAKAEASGELPKVGALRQTWNYIKTAVQATMNRVFNTNFGTADFSPEQIGLLSKAAFIKESYTSTNTAAKEQELFSRAELDPATIAEIDAIHKATNTIAEKDTSGVINQTLQGIKSARENSGIVQTIRQKVVDKYATVDEKVSKMFSQGVRDFFGNINPMVLIRQAEDNAKVVMSFFREGGIRFNKDGLAEVTKGEASMVTVLKKVQEFAKAHDMSFEEAKTRVSTILEGHRLHGLLEYNKGLQESASILDRQGKTNEAAAERKKIVALHMTESEIRALESAYQASDSVKKIQADMNATRSQAIDFMRDAGRITPEQAQFWKENADYVPFSRIFEDDAVPKRFARGNGIAVLRNIPGLEGSMGRPVKNVLDAYSNRLGYMVEEAMRNNATVKLLETMELGGFARRVASADAANNKQLVVPRLFKDGQPAYFEVQNGYDLAAFQQAPEVMNFATKALGSIAGTLRVSITALPPFAIKQVIEDAQRAMIYSGVQRPVVVAMKTLYNLPKVFFGEVTGRKTQAVRRMEELGIVGDYDFNVFRPNTEIEREIGASKRGVARSIFHTLEKFTKASDLAARLAVYEETLLDTKGDETLAQTRARELINFNRRGSSQSMRAAARVIPFFNAYAQGMDVLYRSAFLGTGASSGEVAAARRMFIGRVSMMTAMGLMYAVMMSDDDDYKNASDDVRDGNWLLPGGMKIPVPKELGFIFKSIPERVVSYYNRYGTDEEQSAMSALSSVFKGALSTYGSPTSVPSALRPILENMTNYSFFLQRELESASMQNLEPGKRFTSSTSELAKSIGDYTNISPIKIDNLLRGLFGMTASTAMLMTDAMINPSRPDRPLYQIPFANIFLYDTVGSRQKNEFYDLSNRVLQANNTYRDLAKKDAAKAEEYLKKNVALIQYAPAINSALKKLSEYRKVRTQLEQATEDAVGMSSAERRQAIDQLRKEENELVSFAPKITKLINDYKPE